MKIGFREVVTTFILILPLTFLLSQKNVIADIPNRDSKDPVYTYVTKMAQLPGGKETIQQYLDYYPYPQCGFDKKIEGKVVLQFIVEKNGTISEMKVLSSPDQCLGDAAADYVKHWPSWEPAMYNGQRVSSLFSVPIEYNIDKYNNRPR